MKYKAVVFFDLDGTLLNEHSEITPETKQAIEELRKNNILPVIATGRAYPESIDVLKVSGIDSMVACNGLHVMIENKTIYSKYIDPKECVRLVEFNQTSNHGIVFVNEENIWVHDYNQSITRAFGDLHLHTPPVDENGHLTRNVVMPVIVSFDPKTDDEYRKHFPELAFYRTTPGIMDVVPFGINKGTGIQKAIKILGLEGIPTYAFGDGQNDFHLLENVDYAIAMENAIPKLKEIADFISTSNADNGIVNGLKHYGLI
jgi:Cof subfamily protein (haloacid dehalogenase superfamily)